MTNEIYIVLSGTDYEGGEIVAVVTSPKEAERQAQKHHNVLRERANYIAIERWAPGDITCATRHQWYKGTRIQYDLLSP